MNFTRPLHLLRLAIAGNPIGRFLNSNSLHERFHPQGWEPEVLQFLLGRNWDGAIWDVGASLGRHAYRIGGKNLIYAFEPNLNSLQYLGNNVKHLPNVIIVPCGLTVDGQPMLGTIHPDFLAPCTGPKVATLSIKEALQKFGKPALIKLDIEGGEYPMLKTPDLNGIPLLIEWHGEIPKELPHWNLETIDSTHSFLTPKPA